MTAGRPRGTCGTRRHRGTCAAASASPSSDARTGWTARTENGSVTKSSAIMSPIHVSKRSIVQRARGAVEEEEDDADDDRRQREGEVDEGLDEPLAEELVAHEDPGDRDAHDGVDRRDARATARARGGSR